MTNEEAVMKDELDKMARIERAKEEWRIRRHREFVDGMVVRFNEAIVDDNVDDKKNIISELLKMCVEKRCFCVSCKFRDVCSTVCVDGFTIGSHIDGEKQKKIRDYDTALDLVKSGEEYFEKCKYAYDRIIATDLASAKEKLKDAEECLKMSKINLEKARRSYESIRSEAGV